MDSPAARARAAAIARAEAEAHDRNRRAIFAMCNAFGLTRAERLEVVTVLLDRHVESFKDLSPAEASRLRDAMHGATLVCVIQMEKRNGQRR